VQRALGWWLRRGWLTKAVESQVSKSEAVTKLGAHFRKWSEARKSQPRSGARMQPRGVSPGYKWEMRQPRRGERRVS